MLLPTWLRLPRPHDPAAAARGLDRWSERIAGADPDLRVYAAAVAADPHGRALLEAVFGNSPYLSQSLIREQAFFRTMITQGFEATFVGLLETLKTEADAEGDTARLMARLRTAKRQGALLIALADITDSWGLEAVTRGLSDLADAAIGAATRHLLRRMASAGLIDLPDPAAPENGSGLVILGLGKLGARELNYSSDVDLIIFYDEATVRTRRPDDLSRSFVRFARDLVKLLDERTADGYVFRTDLRLRPDPGATPLAVSFTAAETYYSSVGQNWERAALIRARAVAGDPRAAQAMAAQLRPFLWRRHLDFAAIQDIHSIKRQINAHKGHRQVTVNGHDIKVGRGGIREIEFFAQTQQLIFGGRDARLRTAGTFETLNALVAAGHVLPDTAGQLAGAYRFLRRVEHRLQMIDDRQTHQIPKTDAGVAALATFLGYDDPAGFRADLLEQLGVVEDHYAELFEEAPPLSAAGNLVFTGTDPEPGTVGTLTALGFTNPGAVFAVVAGWHHGRYRATRSARARELLTELVPSLLQAFGRTPSPDTALHRFDEFLARMPAGVQLFSLFYANPNLLDLVAEIFGTAVSLAQVLSRHPDLLDAVLTPGFFDRALPGRAELSATVGDRLTDARDFEDAICLLRRYTNEHRFRAGVHILRNVTDADRCGEFLSDLAEVALSTLLDRVCAEFAVRHGRFPGAEVSILALGKLGGRQLSIGSDLDLIVVYQVPDGQTASDGARPLAPPDYYTRLVKRLITALTAQTGEGRLYEVDMRLRPSGNAGPLAVSLPAFIKYHREQSWTWEHMALSRARPVSGSPAFRQRLEQEVRTVLTRPRDPDALLRAVFHMRERVEKEFSSTSPWEVKYARGGVMDINFIAQYLQLRHAHLHPEVLQRNTVDALEALARAGLVDPAIAAQLTAAQRLWRRIQGFLRLTTEKGTVEAGAVPGGLHPGLTQVVFPNETQPVDFSVVEAKVRETGAQIYRLFQTLIEVPARALPAPLSEEPLLK